MPPAATPVIEMLAPDQTIAEFTLPSLDVRALLRRGALPALGAALAIGFVLAAGGQVHAVESVLRRVFDVNASWAAVGAVFECASIAGYIGLLSLVAGSRTRRIGARESAQITLAGAAATRLLPTAGAGGAALAVWSFRRAGLKPLVAARTLLTFMVLLYSVFLGAIVFSGMALTLDPGHSQGPVALSVLAAGAALLGIIAALVLAFRHPARAGPDLATSRIRRAAHVLGDAVRDACRLVRSGDLRLAGAIAYWAFDAAVLWAMLHAFGRPPEIPVLVLAYFIGQIANTVPLPGSVSGGIAGVLIAFGVPAILALPAVLAYRTIAVWLPTPVAIAAMPALRSTLSRWEREGATSAAEA